MNEQLDIFKVHDRENNPEMQKHLDKNRKKFNKSCKKVFDLLMEGTELTVLWCANNGVSSAPRRFADLKDKGVLISDRWDGNIKIWHMTPDQIEHNKQFL